MDDGTYEDTIKFRVCVCVCVCVCSSKTNGIEYESSFV